MNGKVLREIMKKQKKPIMTGKYEVQVRGPESLRLELQSWVTSSSLDFGTTFLVSQKSRLSHIYENGIQKSSCMTMLLFVLRKE